MTELCPAKVNALVPSAPSSPDAAASAFAYGLYASSERTLDSATIIADTDHGWYRWNVAGVALTKSQHKFAQSPSLQVSFPESLMIHRAWIESANASTCRVPWFIARDAGAQERAIAAAAAIAPASPLEPVAKAHAVAEPFDTIECAEPFRNAMVTGTRSPQIPPEVHGMFPTPVMVKIEVVLDESGKLVDASIYAGSGNLPLDQAVLRAVRASSFSGAVSYCQNVPSDYLLSEELGPY
ncbi:MAG TPA: energy transducer TonB [Candidatus Acidoferrales bacterium]|jgi:TonB family protein|nr:energy transducer TonB [Candidatus Acidoferrales bacterium]